MLVSPCLYQAAINFPQVRIDDFVGIRLGPVVFVPDILVSVGCSAYFTVEQCASERNSLSSKIY